MTAADELDGLARRILAELGHRQETLAVAESLTGGRVAAAVTAVPGASAVFRGGVVAYATDVKAALLHVDRALLDRDGAVSEGVARQMAEGVRRALGATYGLATTGVAGPDPQDGRRPGEAYVAVAGPGGTRAEALTLAGGRLEIAEETARRALGLLGRVLDGSVGEPTA